MERKIGIDKHIVRFACILAIAAMIAASVFVIMKDAEWVMGDDTEFFLPTTAQGKYMPVSLNMWREGRFLPLQMFEYNILNFVPYGHTASAHFALVAAEYLIAVWLFLLLCRHIGKGRIDWLAAVVAMAMLNLSDGFIFVFMDTIFAERVLTPLLLAFCLFYLKAAGGGSTPQGIT